MTLEKSLRAVLSGFTSEDINEIRVINAGNIILATSALDNQSMVGQRSPDDIVRKSIASKAPYDIIHLDEKTRKRVLVRVTPIDFG